MSSAARQFGGKMITCIIPTGRGREILETLRAERNIDAAVLAYARGVSQVSGGLNWEVGDSLEKDIIKLTCHNDEADDIFDCLFQIAEINRPHGGIIFMEALHCSTEYRLPELPLEA